VCAAFFPIFPTWWLRGDREDSRSAPPVAGTDYLDRTDWWDYIVSMPAPRVVVVQDTGHQPGLASLLGAVHVNILRALGCVGAVTNGAVRDIPAAEEIRFPLFAACVSVSHAYVHIVEFGTPVEIGGLGIQSGDLLHGDLHGIQTIPRTLRPGFRRWRLKSPRGSGAHQVVPVAGVFHRGASGSRQKRSPVKN